MQMARTHPIRLFAARDLDQACEIEEQAFEYPWTREDFSAALGKRNCLGLVANGIGDEVLGYLVFSLHTAEIRIESVAVDYRHRRLGIATGLVEKVAGKMSYKRPTLVVDIWERSLDAQLFFQSLGFSCVMIKAGIYEPSSADAAYVFVYHDAIPF